MMQPYSGLQKIPGNLTPAACTLPPDFTKVVLQLHCDGTNGSTSYTDTSNNGFSVSASVPITTTNPKFGTGAALNAGGADAIVIAHNAAFNLGSQDFTLQGWFARTGGASGLRRFLFSKGANETPGSYSFGIHTDIENFAFSWSDGSNTRTIFHDTFMVADVYFHWAVVRYGTNIALYIDGVKRAEATFSGSINSNTAAIRFFEPAFASISQPGRLDEVQFTVGLAEYTGNFTPQTQPFCGVGSGGTPVPITPPPAPPPTPAPSSGAYTLAISPQTVRPGNVLTPVTGKAAFVFTAAGGQPGAALLTATAEGVNLPPGITTFAVESYQTPFNSNVAIIASGTPTTAGVYNVTINLKLSGQIVGSGVWPVTVSTVPVFSVSVLDEDIVLARGVAVDLTIATTGTDIPATASIIGEPAWFAAAGLSLDLNWTSGTPGVGTLKITGTPTLLVIYPALMTVVFYIDGEERATRFFRIRIMP